MLKKVLALVMDKIGVRRLSLRVAEFMLRQLELEWEIPYPDYTNEVIEQLREAADDGVVTSNEIADVIKYFRVGLDK